MRTLMLQEIPVVSGGLTKGQLAGSSIGALVGVIYGTGIGIGFGGVASFFYGNLAGLGICAAFSLGGTVIGGLLGYGIAVAGGHIVDRLVDE